MSVESHFKLKFHIHIRVGSPKFAGVLRKGYIMSYGILLSVQNRAASIIEKQIVSPVKI